MIKHYITIAYRNLLRNKLFSFIQIAGFTLGLTAFIIGAQVYLFENSFDQFHQEKDKVFRLILDIKSYEEVIFGGDNPAIVYAIQDKIPEVAHAARFFDQNIIEPYCVIASELNGQKTVFHEERVAYADPDFLSILTFPVLQGNRSNMLSAPSDIVITQKIARKYFGQTNPMGKKLTITTGGSESNKTQFDYIVSGVLADLPHNSSVVFDVLLPAQNFEDYYKGDLKNNWSWPSFQTFFKTKNVPTDLQKLTTKINALSPAEIRAQQEANNYYINHRIEPINQIHFSESRNFTKSIISSNRTFVLMVGGIGLLILIIAGINYVNLTTAKSIQRAREVGIRKIVGAGRLQLTLQFLTDAFLLNLIGLCTAITIVQLIRPHFINLTGLLLPEFSWLDAKSYLLLGIVCTLSGLFGVIPALLLSGITPVKSMTRAIQSSDKSSGLRKSLVMFQFATSVVLIILVSAIFLQVSLLKSKDNGVDSDHRLVIKAQGTEDFDFTKFRTFKERAVVSPSILNVSAGHNGPGSESYRNPMDFFLASHPGEGRRIDLKFIDYDYVATLGLNLLDGREFTKDRHIDENQALINQQAMFELGFQSASEAIGQTLVFDWDVKPKLKIIGVVQNVQHNSTGDPQIASLYSLANTCHPYAYYSNYYVHLKEENKEQTLSELSSIWYDIFPEAPFEYSYLDQSILAVFEEDERIQYIATISSLLAIFIALLGLIGLVSYSVNQRIKEIGIRKVLGASASNILLLINYSYVKLIGLAIVIAVPIAWYSVDRFLSNYAYRIEINIWLLTLPCLAMMCGVVLLISLLVFKTVQNNPVDSLRTE